MLTRVVKIGGNELDRPDWVAACARALVQLGPSVVVHGGGQAVSAWSRRLGIPVEQRDGLRVTTPEIAQLVEMVLGGPMNRLLVSALRAAGLDALGLSGVDGGLLTAQPLQNGTALGEVGEIVNVRASLLHSLLLAGLTPVVAPVAPSVTAPVRPLNINADQAAAAIAAALEAQELLCFERRGNGGGGLVRVDVERPDRGGDRRRDGCHHRRQSGQQQAVQERRPHVHDFAHLAQCRSVLKRLRCQQATVYAGQSKGIEPSGAERTHEEPIHRPPQYHLDELRDFRRSHAQAVPLLDRDAQPARPGADGLPTAVDDDRRAELYQSPGASGHPVRAIELVAADLDDSR